MNMRVAFTQFFKTKFQHRSQKSHADFQKLLFIFHKNFEEFRYKNYFVFNIKLSDVQKAESKTLFSVCSTLAVRCQGHWTPQLYIRLNRF